MGCWNETCGFSQQSIGAGEKVYAFLILSGPQSKSVYANGSAEPMSFPLEAEYNDYGTIENVKVKMNYVAQSILYLFNTYHKEGCLVASEELEGVATNASDDILFDDVESLFENIERGRISLKLKDWNGKEVIHPVYFMLIKKDVLETAWESITLSPSSSKAVMG